MANDETHRESSQEPTVDELHRRARRAPAEERGEHVDAAAVHVLKALALLTGVSLGEKGDPTSSGQKSEWFDHAKMHASGVALEAGLSYLGNLVGGQLEALGGALLERTVNNPHLMLQSNAAVDGEPAVSQPLIEVELVVEAPTK